MTWVIGAAVAAIWIAVVVLLERLVCGERHCPRMSDHAPTDPWWGPR